MFVEPLGLIHGGAAGEAIERGLAMPLAGGPAAFSLVRLVGTSGGVEMGRIMPVGAVPAPFQAALHRVAAPRPGWAGLTGSPPWIMGILNVTPDSFSDGGRHFDTALAVAAGLAMREAGADLVDVGGESTRPGSAAVAAPEEQQRVLPVIRALVREGVAVSVDTRHAATMRAALGAGARVVNDVSALTHDPAAAGVVAAHAAPVVLMHMRGTPQTMQDHARYGDVAAEVARELAARVAAAVSAGIARERIAIDPGIGFAKDLAHNLDLLNRLGVLLGLGLPLLVGVSRKRFVGTLADEPQALRRGPGSLAAALHVAAQGATVLRVHDVAETVQAVRVWRGMCQCAPADGGRHPG